MMPRLAIAMKSVVPVIKAAAAATAAVGNSEYASHRAHRAADAGTNRAADQTAHRPGNPVAFARAILRAANDALGISGVGDCEQSQSHGRSRQEKPCWR